MHTPSYSLPVVREIVDRRGATVRPTGRPTGRRRWPPRGDAGHGGAMLDERTVLSRKIRQDSATGPLCEKLRGTASRPDSAPGILFRGRAPFPRGGALRRLGGGGLSIRRRRRLALPSRSRSTGVFFFFFFFTRSDPGTSDLPARGGGVVRTRRHDPVRNSSSLSVRPSRDEMSGDHRRPRTSHTHTHSLPLSLSLASVRSPNGSVLSRVRRNDRPRTRGARRVEGEGRKKEERAECRFTSVPASGVHSSSEAPSTSG